MLFVVSFICIIGLYAVKERVHFMNKTVEKICRLDAKHKCILMALAGAFFIVRAVQMISEISINLAYPGATLYLLDFNFYIGTRTFIGSILTLLTPHITYQQIFGLNLFVYAVLILIFAVLWFRTAKKAIEENDNVLLFVLLAFITFPYSLLQYANWIGAYDLYLSLFAALGALTALSKRTHWLFPLFCVMAIFTHYAFVFSYFPAAFVVHVYCMFTSKDKKCRIISTTAAFLLSFVSSVYCVFFANNTIKMTRSELFAYMESRLGMPAGNEGYIDAYYFNDDVKGMVEGWHTQHIGQGFSGNFVLFFLPMMLFFCSLWCYCIIKAKKNQIFPYLCFLAVAAVNVALVFLIVEYPRWLAAATLSQFIIFFVLVKRNDTFVLDFLKRLNQSDIRIWLFIYVIFATLASLTIEPYDVF